MGGAVLARWRRIAAVSLLTLSLIGVEAVVQAPAADAAPKPGDPAKIALSPAGAAPTATPQVPPGDFSHPLESTAGTASANSFDPASSRRVDSMTTPER